MSEQVLGAAVVAVIVILVVIGVVRVIGRRDAPTTASDFGAGGRSTVPPGSEGVARTVLAPSGVVYVAGEEWSAQAAGGRSIAEGDRVRVVDQQGITLIVDAVSTTAPGE